MTDISKEAVERLADNLPHSQPFSPNSHNAASTLRALSARIEELEAQVAAHEETPSIAYLTGFQNAIKAARTVKTPGKRGQSGEKWDGWSDEKYRIYQLGCEDMRKAILALMEGAEDDAVGGLRDAGGEG